MYMTEWRTMQTTKSGKIIMPIITVCGGGGAGVAVAVGGKCNKMPNSNNNNNNNIIGRVLF